MQGARTMTTMTKSEEDIKLDIMDKYFDAMEAGNFKKAKDICREIILSPEAAMKMYRSMGKKRVLATGLNLSAANAVFGEGWLDEKPQPRRFH